MTTANVDERISKSPLLPLLLAASGSRSSIHLTMHPCSILAHLHYVYGIENVGQRRQLQLSQEDDDELDTRVYRYLSLLYARGWGNPLMRNDDDDDDNSGITRDDEESYGGREYDNPSSSKVVLDLLGCSSKVHGSAAGRCVVEYALRGVNKSNKRSDVSKIARGLEGLRRREEMDQKGLSATRISEVLRIKGRALKRTGAIAEREVSSSGTTTTTTTTLLFRLGTG